MSVTIKPRVIIVGAVVFLATINACNKEHVVPSVANNNIIEDSNFDYTKLNTSLKEYTFELAGRLENHSFRKEIYKELGKKFDGDYDVLIKDFDNISLTNELPKLQISFPKNFDSWELESEIPLVAYIPFGVDDEELSFIPAFDKDGNHIELDAFNIPNIPVIVININERVDNLGNVIYTESEYASAKTSEDVEILKIKKLKVNDLHEPWYKGDAEVCLKVKPYYQDASTNYFWDLVDHEFEVGQSDEGNWTTEHLSLFEWDFGSYAVFQWYEKDGEPGLFTGLSKYSVTYNGAVYYFSVSSKDDNMGYNVIYNSQLSGTSYNSTKTFTSSDSSIRYNLYLN